MENFGQLLHEIKRILPESRLTPCSDDEIDAIRQEYPGIPKHYLSFLKHVGWGSFGDSTFMIYGGPCEPSEFFDDATSQELGDILFFGDDFAGWMAGFEMRNDWRIVGVESSSRRPHVQEAQTIGQFMAQVVADQE